MCQRLIDRKRSVFTGGATFPCAQFAEWGQLWLTSSIAKEGAAIPFVQAGTECLLILCRMQSRAPPTEGSIRVNAGGKRINYAWNREGGQLPEE